MQVSTLSFKNKAGGSGRESVKYFDCLEGVARALTKYTLEAQL